MKRNCFAAGQKIIDVLGGLDKLDHIRLQSSGFMDLVLERVGEGPRNRPLVSVAHYYEQNGDLMRDPEMTFEVESGMWLPVSYTQDNLGIYNEAVFQDEHGVVLCRPKMLQSLTSFARQWSKNLVDQGFVTAATLVVAGRVSTVTTGSAQ